MGTSSLALIAVVLYLILSTIIGRFTGKYIKQHGLRSKRTAVLLLLQLALHLAVVATKIGPFAEPNLYQLIDAVPSIESANLELSLAYRRYERYNFGAPQPHILRAFETLRDPALRRAYLLDGLPGLRDVLRGRHNAALRAQAKASNQPFPEEPNAYSTYVAYVLLPVGLQYLGMAVVALACASLPVYREGVALFAIATIGMLALELAVRVDIMDFTEKGSYLPNYTPCQKLDLARSVGMALAYSLVAMYAAYSSEADAYLDFFVNSLDARKKMIERTKDIMRTTGDLWRSM